MTESEETDIIPVPTSIVRANTEIAPVNSALAETEIPSQEALSSVTFWKLDLDTILDGLIPDPLPESSGKDNAIHHLNIIIFGKANTGKTTLGESLMQALARRYGQRNVRGLRSTRDLPALFQNLGKVFGRFRKPPKAVLLFADDMTKALGKLSGTVTIKKSGGQLEKMRKVDYWLDKWYDVRGELARYGMRQGLVVMVAGLHRFYAGRENVDLRADADLLLVRSTGTPGTFDATKVEKMLGPTVYYAMRQHEVDALRDRKELAWTAFVAKTGTGVFRVPRPSVSEKWLLRNVGESEVSEEATVEPSESKERIKEEPVRTAKAAVNSKRVARPMVHKKSKSARRVSRVTLVAGALALVYLAWMYLWPLLKPILLP